MVEDYLSDREREEALRDWWRENWRWIIGGAVLGLALLGGWRYWQAHRDQRALSASQLYAEFQGALQAHNVDQASRLLTDLQTEHARSAYTQQGRLLLAKAHVDEGKVDEAMKLLDAVAKSAKDDELAQVANLRSARLLIDQGKYEEALKLLDPDAAGAFAAKVRELRGDALAAKGDEEGARAEYAAALTANADAQIDRTLVELKLQEVGGARSAAAQGQP
ncbi:MAG TPA: tetratricopeptide repeat protein [Steroidobacter sp.]|jgi:predicted negative regulator of RcsB-dependent stress response|nr:tetratricopeptide repeat protein [Steroidobacter sp.]